MVEVSHKELKQLFKTIDKNNPKFELDYLYVSPKRVASSDTRSLSVINHNSSQEFEPFLLHGSAVEIALKIKKTDKFVLNHDGIKCLNEINQHIMTIQQPQTPSQWHFPDTEKIIPTTFKKEVDFYQKEQISGVLLANNVFLDKKYVPEVNEGTISINGANKPVLIKDEHTRLTYLAMPICGVFEDND